MALFRYLRSLHVVAVILALTSLVTGLRISIVSHTTWQWLSPLLPQGNVHQWHFAAGAPLLVLILIYMGYRVYVGLLRSSSKKGTKGYHRWVKWLGYMALCLLATSGLLLWFDTWIDVARPLHFYAASLFMLYLLLHGWIYLLQKGKGVLVWLVPSFSKATLLTVFSLGTLGWFLFAFGQQGETVGRVLSVKTITTDTLWAVDGKADEAFWDQVPRHTIETSAGANFVNGQTKIHVRAVDNGIETLFLIEWQDETESLTHLPLLKTQGRWVVQQQGFSHFNETRYYEDKFAVMLSSECAVGADNTLHLGPKPLQGKPANWHGKGYHAALDGRTRDLWHWKAVRTNPMYQADDNLFTAAQLPLDGERRYKAGYMTDPKESGGYVMNWQWFKTASVTPKRLPLEQVDPLAARAHLDWYGSAPYEQQNDTYLEGQQLPSVLYRSNQFEGDRGDVRAHGVWKQGKWTLELARLRDTESDYDVVLENGVCLWFAAFDAAQIGHTRHQMPLRLQYEGAMHGR
ncbi:ethylbenzene dehydrogenase-related protein [Thaumasiovibrio subtropicus]|uniref:ethylbenzene dehydrogenase-related protein n=1 Tax=Thaumasiovibrio subtropicus TaxID=1891207 RepID=UPI000B34AFFA|nr:ethylbenzene dehydrogenase-related protein [Thaumasiovibrio subtropicus]